MSLLLDRAARANRTPPDAKPALVRTAFVPSGIVVAVLAVVVAITLASASSAFTGFFGAVAAAWLAVHQVPLLIGATTFSALPLLPTLATIALVARFGYRAASPDDSPRALWRLIGSAVAGPLVVTIIALAVVQDATTVTQLHSPNTVQSLGGVAGVHALAAALGVGLRVWPRAAERLQVPQWTRTALRQGALAGLSLLASGAFLVLIGLIDSWSTVGALFRAEDGFTDRLGLLVLSVLYLPNVVIAMTASLVGADTHIADAAFGLFHTTPGPVPALPILGVLPTSSGGLMVVLTVLPLIVAIRLGRGSRRERAPRLETVRTVVAAAAGCATVFALLGFLGGGRLGYFGHVGVVPPLFGLLVFAWLAPIGVLAALAPARPARPSRRDRRKARAERKQEASAEAGPADDVADDLQNDLAPDLQDDLATGAPHDELLGGELLGDEPFDDEPFDDEPFDDEPFEDDPASGEFTPADTTEAQEPDSATTFDEETATASDGGATTIRESDLADGKAPAAD